MQKRLVGEALNEVGNLLSEAHQEGFAVTVTHSTKAGVRKATRRATEQRGATKGIVLDVRDESLRVPAANLMRVETAAREQGYKQDCMDSRVRRNLQSGRYQKITATRMLRKNL